MDSTCIEKNTVSGIRLIGQKYQAKLVLEPAKLLGAWRHCLHASADSRTGILCPRSRVPEVVLDIGGRRAAPWSRGERIKSMLWVGIER